MRVLSYAARSLSLRAERSNLAEIASSRERLLAMTSLATTSNRAIPERIEDRLIVALDLPEVAAARAITERLDGVVSYYKLGYWLMLAPGFEGFLDALLNAGKRIFLDTKMFDIGETVREGVRRAAGRGISLVTVHGDGDIVRAAVDGRGGSDLRILAITALTSLDEAGLRELGHSGSVADFIGGRVAKCVAWGCDGVIASPDDVAAIRAIPGAERLLVVTPGVRLAGAGHDDHKRSGTPAQAIAAGADYLVVGRPIVRSDDPAAAAARIIADMASAA
jgi:orotidine-5'-phosphate decarboxylase